MKVKLVRTQDFYSTMCEWWDGHNFTRVSPSLMPMNTFVCYNDEGKEIYSTCFYNTDSNLCWLGWQISNPRTTKEERKGGLGHLLNEVGEYAKGEGYQVIFTTTPDIRVQTKLTELGYVVGDSNVTHLTKTI